MKCLNCGRDTNEESLFCVECMSEDELSIELPELKKEETFDAIKYVDNNLEDTKEFFLNREIDLGKTRAINPLVNTKEYDLFTLEDEINKQIDEINSSVDDDNVAIYVEGGFDDEELSKTTIMKKFDKVSNTNDLNENLPKLSKSLMDEDLTTNESIIKRKNSLVIAFVCTLSAILIAFVGISYFYNIDSELFGNTEGKEDYLSNITSVLDDYYVSLDNTELVNILDKIKNDEEDVIKLQDAIINKVNVWVDNFKNGDLSSKDNFEKVYFSNKRLINNLYNVSLNNKDDVEIKLISLSNYKKYIDDLENIYDCGLPYYEALDYYNDKSYNEAYQMLSYVEEGNIFYDKSRSCMDKIVKDIISLLNNDISKINEGIDSLTESEKMDKYISIEEIIVTYDVIYHKVNLRDNDDYKALLDEYRNLINGEVLQEQEA